ncbi:hypothetical protein Tco_1189138 [Tanacetum coccineum]
MLQICPKLPNQQFEELPFEEAILTFLRDLGHSGEIKIITDVNVNKLHQPWRSFAAVINKCLSGKSTGYDSLRLSQAQILRGMYHKKNVDYAYLLWENFIYQVENKNVKKSNEMYYPRFTKVIVNFFMTKDQSIPRQNSVNWHYDRDDYMFTMIKVVSRHEDTHLYGTILPNELPNEDIRNSESYKEYYAIALGAKPPKSKARFKKKQVGSDMSKTPPTKGKRLKTSVKAAKTAKKKQPAKTSKAKCLTVLSEKSSEEDDDDEVNVSEDNDDDNDDDIDKDDKDDYADNQDDENTNDANQDDDDEQTESDNDINEEESDDESNEDSDEEVQGAIIEEKEIDEEATHEEDEANELYRDVNVNLEGRDTEMTNAPLPNVQGTQVTEDTHVIITAPFNYEGIDSIFTLNTEATLLVDVPVTTIVEPPLLFASTLPPPPTPLITHQQQTLIPTPPTVPSSSLQYLPNFGSLFGFDHRLKTLENNFSKFNQMNQFAAAVSLTSGIVDAYLANKMHEAVKTAVRLQSERLRDEAQAENAYFFNKLDDNIKKIIKYQVKEQVKAQVSKILPKIKKTVNEQLEAEVLTRSSNESKTSHDVAANLSELELKKILIDRWRTISQSTYLMNKGISTKHWLTLMKVTSSYFTHIEIQFRLKDVEMMRIKTKNPPLDQTGGPREEELEKNQSLPVHLRKRPPRQLASQLKGPNLITMTFQYLDWFQKPAKPPTLDRDWNKTLHDAHGPVQPCLSSLAQMEDLHESFNEVMDTPFNFSAFMMNRLKVDTLTPELLSGPTFELMKESCKSLIELEYFLEEVYKATIDQLDWINPEGQQYPHDLGKPLPLIPNSQGRQVIPFDNNDLEYLSGGVSSRKYATSVTKTKAADYRHIKWIEDLGRKQQQFYGFAFNRESAQDVYSKRRIITVTNLQIVEWHNYKHLDWITVRRDDDKLYKFKEGDFNRLRIQDIEGMLLLLVQGKLTNLIVEECLAFNVSLRMFIRSIVIQRRVEDLQLGVESYQKKLNLTKPDILMGIDELHKFSDGTLIDVRTALNDRLKEIRMKYLPQTIWRQSDRDKAGAMI